MSTAEGLSKSADGRRSSSRYRVLAQTDCTIVPFTPCNTLAAEPPAMTGSSLEVRRALRDLHRGQGATSVPRRKTMVFPPPTARPSVPQRTIAFPAMAGSVKLPIRV